LAAAARRERSVLDGGTQQRMSAVRRAVSLRHGRRRCAVLVRKPAGHFANFRNIGIGFTGGALPLSGLPQGETGRAGSIALS